MTLFVFRARQKILNNPLPFLPAEILLAVNLSASGWLAGSSASGDDQIIECQFLGFGQRNRPVPFPRFQLVIVDWQCQTVVSELVFFCQHRKGRTEFSQQYRIITKSGEVRWTDDRTWMRRDDQGNITHYQGLVLDITKQRQAEAEHVRLQQEIIEAQQRAIAELSTPVIPIMDRIIVMPLIGSIDSLRARDVTRTLLAGIQQHRAKVVILDVTGVGIMDTGIVNHLNKTIQAARLKGAQTIVTGMSDAVAEAIVDLGIDWSGIQTLSDLQTGLMVALQSLGVKLSR